MADPSGLEGLRTKYQTFSSRPPMLGESHPVVRVYTRVHIDPKRSLITNTTIYINFWLTFVPSVIFFGRGANCQRTKLTRRIVQISLHQRPKINYSSGRYNRKTCRWISVPFFRNLTPQRPRMDPFFRNFSSRTCPYERFFSSTACKNSS